jgi:hypothetical protein
VGAVAARTRGRPLGALIHRAGHLRRGPASEVTPSRSVSRAEKSDDRRAWRTALVAPKGLRKRGRTPWPFLLPDNEIRPPTHPPFWRR